MSVNRKRTEPECIVCHNARPSAFRKWCDRCWQQLTNEEKLLAAEAAAAEEDAEEMLAPPRLAQPHERRNGHGFHIEIAGPEDMRAMRARGFEPTTLRTPFGGIVYRRKSEAR